MYKPARRRKVRRYITIHPSSILNDPVTALESLITTLRSHMSRLTLELSPHKTLLDKLCSLREADKNTLRQKVREVDLLRQKVEKIEGLREREGDVHTFNPMVNLRL